MNGESIHVPISNSDGTDRRTADGYALSTEQVAFFRSHGYLVLRGVVSAAETDAIERVFDTFMRGEVTGMGKDFCDMSGTAKSLDEFTLINAMLPRVYRPDLRGNPFERRSQAISSQLIGADIGLDYDQFLAKQPRKADAVFAWHQDMGYWPKKTPDTRTVTCSLALDDADLENGCLRVVPGTQDRLRHHRPLVADLARESRSEALSAAVSKGKEREESHALVVDLESSDEVVYLPVKRGDITLHDEMILHGSAGNRSQRWRRTYVIAYRSLATIAWERRMGFTHSHNDAVSWDAFERLEGSARA